MNDRGVDKDGGSAARRGWLRWWLCSDRALGLAAGWRGDRSDSYLEDSSLSSRSGATAPVEARRLQSIAVEGWLGSAAAALALALDRRCGNGAQLWISWVQWWSGDEWSSDGRGETTWRLQTEWRRRGLYTGKAVLGQHCPIRQIRARRQATELMTGGPHSMVISEMK
jgi:hypothetical protein